MGYLKLTWLLTLSQKQPFFSFKLKQLLSLGSQPKQRSISSPNSHRFKSSLQSEYHCTCKIQISKEWSYMWSWTYHEDWYELQCIAILVRNSHLHNLAKQRLQPLNHPFQRSWVQGQLNDITGAWFAR